MKIKAKVTKHEIYHAGTEITLSFERDGNYGYLYLKLSVSEAAKYPVGKEIVFQEAQTL